MWAVVGLGVLYFWLTGNWFARVVAWVALTAVFIVILDPNAIIYRDALLFIFIACGVAAWFVSGIPIYVQRTITRRIERDASFIIPYPH